jgi:hypothetical protein
MYDCGVLHIASEGCENTLVAGYLEVEYDIELIGKQSTVVPTGIGYGYPTFSITQPYSKALGIGTNSLDWEEGVVFASTLDVVFTDIYTFKIPTTGIYELIYTFASNGSVSSTLLYNQTLGGNIAATDSVPSSGLIYLGAGKKYTVQTVLALYGGESFRIHANCADVTASTYANINSFTLKLISTSFPTILVSLSTSKSAASAANFKGPAVLTTIPMDRNRETKEKKSPPASVPISPSSLPSGPPKLQRSFASLVKSIKDAESPTERSRTESKYEHKRSSSPYRSV